MTSLQEQYAELLALTQLHLLQSHGSQGQLVVAKDNLSFFGATPGVQKTRQPIPEPVPVMMPLPAPVQKQEPAPKQSIVNEPVPEPEKVLQNPKASGYIGHRSGTGSFTKELPEIASSTPQVDFKEMHDIVRKLFPSQAISKEIPGAAATGVVLVSDSTELPIVEFVQKVAEAIRTRLGHEVKILPQYDPNSCVKFVIATEKQVENVVTKDNVLAISDWSIYLQEPQRKTDLWQSIIKSLRE